MGGTDDPQEPSSHTLHLQIPVTFSNGQAPSSAYTHRSRVNDEAGNAFTAWQQMGRPASPTNRQLELLYDAAEPVIQHSSQSLVPGPDGVHRIDLPLTLARHEVTLIEIDPVRDETPSWLDDRRILGR